MWNTDKEYNLTLGYEINKKILATINFDSDYKGGAGVKIRF
jgi:hypothetical protein